MAFLPQMFISYSRESEEDFRFALRLANDIRTTGIKVWIDQPDFHAGEIAEEALANTDALLVILSPASVKSPRVREEVEFSKAHGKWVDAVLLHTCELVDPFTFYEPFDFTKDYHTGLRELLQFIRESFWGEGPDEEDEVSEDLTSYLDERRPQQQQQQQWSPIVGGLRVMVMDCTGAVVCNATVTAADEARDFTRTVTSNSIGVSEFLSLTPGQYTVSVESPGFSKQSNRHVRVTIGEVAELPVTLSVAASNTTVEVWEPQSAQSEQTGAGSKQPAKKKATRKPGRVRPPRAYIDYEPPAAPPMPEAAPAPVLAPSAPPPPPAAEPQPAGAVPSPLVRDNVQFTLTGPAALAPGDAHELLFWVHVEEQRATVLVRAATELGRSVSAGTRQPAERATRHRRPELH
jgi:TIR domain/Carboxypeptidase regulatory-like domain